MKKKQQKWSGVKLTKKELEEVRKEEKLEILAEITAFLIILGLIFFVMFSFWFIGEVFK